jgi:hypothetical protein
MSDDWFFIVGWALMFVLGAVIWNRLVRDFQHRPGASIQTVALVWALSPVHFTLGVLAAVKSTWHFSLPMLLALGGGIAWPQRTSFGGL